MEKHRLNISTPGPKRASYTRFYICLLLSAAFLGITLYSRFSSGKGSNYHFDEIATNDRLPELEEKFVWSQITPTKYLEYVPCFGKFECARLDVPMDHKSPSEQSRVAVAVIRYPALVSILDPRYAGPILLNPGGPGGSGIEFELQLAETISKIANPPYNSADPKAKFYDIVSFDPRGVNNTTPHIDCFPDSTSYDIYNLQTQTEGLGSPETRSKAWARTRALGSGCSDQSSEIIHHMNTPPVVADMVQIIERHGEWRSKQADLLTNTSSWKTSTSGLPNDHPFSRESILERTQYNPGQEKLNYWGFSYGTILGATFAALEPHRVGRLIIDGVCDANDYYNTTWLTNLRDTDTVMQKFYTYCSNTTFEKCPLNTIPSTHVHLSAEEIEDSVQNLLARVKENPIPVPGTRDRAPDIITYWDLMSLFKDSVYKPLQLFPKQAFLLADLIYSNGTLFADYKASLRNPSCPLSCNSNEKENCHVPTSQSSTAILCSDGLPLDWNKTSWLTNMDTLQNQSRYLGEYWSSITMWCSSWKARPQWEIQAGDIKGEINLPILMIGNERDPVTPVYNAHTMKARFPGSEVLTQNSEGHCSISSPSLCTAKAVRAYFQSGVLPAPGTICEPEELPFIGKNVIIEREMSLMSGEDRELLGILEDMRGLDVGVLGFV